jgi:hypothetical protein
MKEPNKDSWFKKITITIIQGVVLIGILFLIASCVPSMDSSGGQTRSGLDCSRPSC